jgi:hypothetical protein
LFIIFFVTYSYKSSDIFITGDIYLGNISLDEDGKMEKNGEGIQIDILMKVNLLIGKK